VVVATDRARGGSRAVDDGQSALEALMTRQFVAVGGTGQHVALALADFLVLAHTVVPDPIPPLEFLLLDSDPAAAEVDTPSAWHLCAEQLDLLASVPDRAAGAPRGDWRSPVPVTREGVRIAREAVDDVLGIGASEVLLTTSQQEIPVTSGYHGEPRVAAILTDVLLDRLASGKLPENDALRRLAAAMAQSDDRLCLAGSTVGGTGSGVLPRLVEHLVSQPNRQAKFCALIGLEWFELENDAVNQERMAANSVASLWHYVQRQQEGLYRLVLWAHPNVAQARRERSFGNRSQGAKTDLTLPYYAAAAAMCFLFGTETAQEHVAPVSTPGSLQLPRCLEILPKVDLGWLIRRNHDLIGRLTLLATYLERPYAGAVLPLFRGGGVVTGVDKLSRSRHDELLSEIYHLIRAKERALARMKASDPNLAVGGPRAFQGISVLRKWIGENEPSIGLFASLLDSASLETPEPSQFRALPQKALVNAGFDQQPVGRRARLAQANVDSLADFIEVQALRIPNAHGVERLLGTFFDNPVTYWTRGDQPVASLLIDDTRAAVPPPLGALTADIYVPWVQRWFALFGALCSGAARVEPLERSILGISHQIVTDTGAGEEMIGYLSPEFGCVPAPTPFWFDATRVGSLVARVGSVRGRLGFWTRTLQLASACKYGSTKAPQWLKFLGEIFAPMSSSGDLTADGSRSMPLRFGSATIDVPLPAPARNGSKSLAQAMADALGLEVKELVDIDDDFTETEKEAWNDLVANRCDGALFQRDNAAWERPTPTPIVWIDLVNEKTRAALDGNIYFAPNRGWAWRMGGGIRTLTAADVLTATVGVFNPGSNAAIVAAYPVRIEYTPLLETCETKRHPDNSVVATVKLIGRAPLQQSYTPSQVRVFDRLKIFSWPKVTAQPNATQSILFESGVSKFRFRMLYGDTTKRVTAASSVMSDQLYPQYLVPAENNIKADERPVALSVIVFDRDRRIETPVGLLTFHDAFSADTGTNETWSVDLGTSSTVIARRRANDSTPAIVHPTQNRDATQVYSMGEPVDRKGLTWYPTWAENAPYDSRTLIMPSQIIDLSLVGRRVDETDISKRLFWRDFTLDHGEEILKDYMPGVIADLKWRKDARQAFRSHFLFHVIEQALTMEMAKDAEEKKPRPEKITMTFTLPLRQRDDVARFTKEVVEVTDRLKKRVGVKITPRFEWESLAIAPQNMAGIEGMIVVADLGGGTLDLFAASFENAKKTNEAVDSAYVGGHRAIEILLRNKAFGDGDFASYARMLRAGEYGDMAIDRKAVASSVPALREYFELLYRHLALWTAALRAKWRVKKGTPVRLQLAGLGWSLPGAPGRQRDIAELVSDAAASLNLDFKFQASETDLPGEARKTVVAESVSRAGGSGRSKDEIAASADRLHMVLGLPVVASGSEYPASTEPRQVRMKNGAAAQVLRPAAEMLVPSVTSSMLDELARRMSTVADPNDPRRGALNPTNLGLDVSPLTSLAEIAVDQLVERQS
jgi:hypothetical protein